MAKEYYNKEELEKIKQVQRLAYECVTAVEAKLEEGMTEKQVSNMLDDYLKQRGVRNFFHMGFAWFGDRAGFHDFSQPLEFNSDIKQLVDSFLENTGVPIPHFGFEFMPSDRKLKKGMGIILDVAPTLNGWSADIGYACVFGNNTRVDKAIEDLEPFRSVILDMVKKEKTMAEIYKVTENMIFDMGYENSHGRYPLGVLAHKVGPIPLNNVLPPLRIMGFHPHSLLYLIGHRVQQLINPHDNKTPFWTRDAMVRPEPGLWAVEPHIGSSEFGVKWEEILVVTDTDAFWLDDDLPHVNRWKSKNKAA